MQMQIHIPDTIVSLWKRAGFAPMWKEQPDPAATGRFSSDKPNTAQSPKNASLVSALLSPASHADVLRAESPVQLPVTDVSDYHSDTTPASVPAPPVAPASLPPAPQPAPSDLSLGEEMMHVENAAYLATNPPKAPLHPHDAAQLAVARREAARAVVVTDETPAHSIDMGDLMSRARKEHSQ